MPDILPQDAVISPRSPSAEPPVVEQMPKAVETTEPVENIYSIEDYDHVFKNKEMFSDDEYSDIKKSFSTHSFNSKDAQYAVDNMNLGVTINETLKSRIPKIKESEVMKDLTLNPSGIDKFMPPLERAEYRKNKFTKDVYDESNLKHINALHYSKTLNIPIDEVYADYSNVQQQYHGAGFGFVIDDTTAFNQIKEIYHPDSLTLGEAVSVGYSRMKANWNRASDREDLNERAYGSIFAGDDITSFIDERKKQQSINRIPASGDNAFTNSFYEAVGMGSQFVGSWIEGAKGAAIGGAGGLALGAVTGPGAVATGLAGAGKGFSVGSFKYWTEQGTSSMMMDMVESGIS